MINRLLELFRSSPRSLLALISILGFAALLRYNNLSPYLIYPDSYQSLLVAHNILNGFGLVGQLGSEGMWYPGFVWWTRPGYAWLIALLQNFDMSLHQAGMIVSFVASLAALPLCYYLLKIIWRNSVTALTGAAMLALSYAHTVWSGYVQTESLGVLSMFMLLIALFKISPQRGMLGDWRFLLLGGVLALAVLVRYEYIVLLAPGALLAATVSPNRLNLFISVLSSFIFVMSIILFGLWPLPFTSVEIVDQLEPFLLLSAGIGSAFILLLTLQKYAPKLFYELQSVVTDILSYLIPFIVLVVLIDAGIHSIYGSGIFEGARNFFLTDFMISGFAAIGLWLLLRSKQHAGVGQFCLLAIAILGLVYYEVNPAMQRYWTHILPILIIPASYGIIYAIERLRVPSIQTYARALLAGLAVLVSVQVLISCTGLHDYRGGLWFRRGYEELSAGRLDKIVPNGALLIVSMPEPYYYFTENPVRSLSAEYPFVYLDDIDQKRDIYVINDMGMRFYFPEFYQRMNSSAATFKAAEYYVGEPFRESNNVVDESEAVVVYKMRIEQLKPLLEENSQAALVE